MYTAEIKRSQDTSNIEALFKAEDTVFPNGRAQYAVENGIIHVTANDTSSFRAAMNSITTILDIYDKSKL